jgi:exopolysaccharide biosynthesis WecB/TagA/CpsF family protein
MDWLATTHRSNEGAPARVVVNVTSRDALLADLSDRMANRRPFQVATLNLDHVVKLHQDERFRAAYVSHSHVTADGNPIVWLSRLSGQNVSLVPGSELVEPLVDLAARQGVPTAFIGGTPQTLQKMAYTLRRRHPALDIRLLDAPEMGFDPESASAEGLISRVAASGARLVFVGLGAPRQEQFVARAAGYLKDTGFVSVGAGLDFIAGTQSRAPRAVRGVAAEWLWRLFGDPGRLAGRYARCIAVLPSLTQSALRQRRAERT